MNLAMNRVDAARASSELQFADTFNQTFDQEVSGEFNKDLDDKLRQHGRMMALLGRFVK